MFLQVIYVDVLLCINLFINYFLLLATAKMICLSIKRKRLVFGAFIGALTSLSIFLPDIGALIFPFRLFVSALIVLSSFGFKTKRLFIKQLALFLVISFLFAGIMFAVLTAFPKCGGNINNSVVYMNISPLTLIFSTLICYIAVRIMSRFTKGSLADYKKEALVTVEIFGECLTLRALCDTGSFIEETFSGYPVIVTDLKVIKRIIPIHILPFFERGETVNDFEWNRILRIVPCETVSGNSFLKCFRPDKVTVSCNNGISVIKNVYIGAADKTILGGEFDAIINPEIIENSDKTISLKEKTAL